MRIGENGQRLGRGGTHGRNLIRGSQGAVKLTGQRPGRTVGVLVPGESEYRGTGCLGCEGLDQLPFATGELVDQKEHDYADGIQPGCRAVPDRRRCCLRQVFVVLVVVDVFAKAPEEPDDFSAYSAAPLEPVQRLRRRTTNLAKGRPKASVSGGVVASELQRTRRAGDRRLHGRGLTDRCKAGPALDHRTRSVEELGETVHDVKADVDYSVASQIVAQRHPGVAGWNDDRYRRERVVVLRCRDAAT